jgi:type VII secretion-associated serine protease mycosin
VSPNKNRYGLCVVAALAIVVSQLAISSIASASNDPAFSSQWGLDVANIKDAQSISTGAGVTVAVIDSGSGPNPDLTQNMLSGRSIIRGRFGDLSADVDTVGHGTHVAGIIAGQRDNAIGITGIAPDAKILPIRILDSRGDGSESDLVQAIRLAVDLGAKVINLSLGGRTQTTALQLALEFAELNQVLVVAAAGNGGSTANTTYPAGNDLTVAVTAVDQTSNAPSFNQRGAYIDVAAPGVSICSTIRIDANVDASRRCAGSSEPYATMSGTSMAAAFVSGVAALVYSVRPELTAAQVRELITTTAKDIGVVGRDETFGSGLINAYAIFKALGYFPDKIVFPTVSSLGRVGQESVGGTAQIPASERLQWYRCLTPGDATLDIPIDCVAIPLAQKDTYTPTRKDIKSFLRFGTLITVGGNPQMRFSATTTKISAIWTTISTLERNSNISIAELVGSASKGNIATRVVSGPCKIVKKVLIPTSDGQCTLRIVVDAKAPYSRLTQTVFLEVVTKNEASS